MRASTCDSLGLLKFLKLNFIRFLVNLVDLLRVIIENYAVRIDQMFLVVFIYTCENYT